MSDILKMLFTDNPELDSKIYQFLAANPEYRKAEQEYERMILLVREKLGYELYNQFEKSLIGYTGRQANPHPTAPIRQG